MGSIRLLGINVGKQKPMKYEKKIKIIKNFGIDGDRFSKINDTRQIMIVDGKLYDNYDLKGVFSMAKVTIMSSRRFLTRSKYKKTSIGRKAARGKMNKHKARTYKSYRGQGK